MIVLKVTILFGIACAVVAEKKIELQDIEEDNLKSEKETELEKSGHGLQTSHNSETGLIPLEFLKSGLLRYFESTPTPEPRYVHQYSVTEAPERLQTAVHPKPQFGASPTQQAMVGYLSNVPMQIYLVPQYYQEQSGHEPTSQPAVHYSPASSTRVGYQGQHEAVQTQTNYIEIPAYVPPTAKTYVPHYSNAPVSVSYSPRPTAAPQPTAAPVIYRPSVVQYQAPAVAQTVPAKQYYQNVQYTTDIDAGHDDDSNSITHTEVTYQKVPSQEYNRYYPSRTPLREEYRHSTVPELPHPNPLLLKASPSHLSHIPKALPLYRPISKPVYSSVHNSVYTPRPQPQPYGPPYKRRPTSLLDSYIPSHVQIEYMRRGFAKDPAEAYEALSTGRHLAQVSPRDYERGFLPNQMYHTAAGGITFGHYKRSPKGSNAQRE